MATLRTTWDKYSPLLICQQIKDGLAKIGIVSDFPPLLLLRRTRFETYSSNVSWICNGELLSVTTLGKSSASSLNLLNCKKFLGVIGLTGSRSLKLSILALFYSSHKLYIGKHSLLQLSFSGKLACSLWRTTHASRNVRDMFLKELSRFSFLHGTRYATYLLVERATVEVRTVRFSTFLEPLQTIDYFSKNTDNFRASSNHQLFFKNRTVMWLMKMEKNNFEWEIDGEICKRKNLSWIFYMSCFTIKKADADR